MIDSYKLERVLASHPADTVICFQEYGMGRNSGTDRIVQPRHTGKLGAMCEDCSWSMPKFTATCMGHPLQQSRTNGFCFNMWVQGLPSLSLATVSSGLMKPILSVTARELGMGY